MRYLFLMRGLPASGKDTFIHDNNFGPWTLSSDEYRLRCGSPTISIDGREKLDMTVSNMAWKKLRKDLEDRMVRGDTTIINATNINKKDILSYRSLCKKYFYRLGIIDLTHVSASECKERNSRRPEMFRVPDETIDRMANKLNSEDIPKSIKTYSRQEFVDFMYKGYKPIDISGKKLHVIGDIHGCFGPVKEYMDKFVDIENDIVVFVGDYFDRGVQEPEVFKYLSSIMDKDNVYLLIGNHELHMFRYLRGEERDTHFDKVTLPRFKATGITDKQMKTFCHNLITVALFTKGDKQIIISHAGVPHTVVNAMLSDTYFIKGSGRYEDMATVADTFDKKFIGRNSYQIFGHRNPDNVDIKINEHCYNVCGFPELGRELKAVQVSEKGEFKCISIHNDTVDKDVILKAIQKGNKVVDISKYDAITVMQNSKFIKENKFGNISSFNFTKEAFYDDVWDGITTKARGLFYNMNNREIVARSYDKFFLLNQHLCSTIDKFEFPIKGYFKYDGSLGIIGYDKETNDLVFCSKSMTAPEGEHARWFKDLAMSYIKDYNALKEYICDNNLSIVCEMISPWLDPHLMSYHDASIIFLDAVKRDLTFTPVDYDKTYDDIKEWFTAEKKKFFRRYNGEKEFAWDYSIIKEYPDTEGFVFVDANHKMFKIKTYNYEAKKIVRATVDCGLPEQRPSYESIAKRYSNFFDKPVIDKVYEELGKNY